MSHVRSSAFVVLSLIVLVSEVAAHGGVVPLPAGPKKGGVVVKPAAAPTAAGAPATSQGAGARPSSSRAARAARTSVGASSVAGGTRGGTRTGAGLAGTSAAPDASGWEPWWAANRDAYLGLRSHLVGRSTVSGSVGALTGRGRRTPARSYRPGDGVVDGRVVPALLELIADSDDADVLDSAVLAAARSTRGLHDDRVLAALRAQLGSRHLSVQSAAALALGALDHEGGRDALKALVRDDSEGRRLAGGKVPDLTRSFAALSLGLSGRASDAILLADIVRRTPDSERDVKICSVVALGLLGADASVSTGVHVHLLALLADRRLDPAVRRHVPTALARSDDPAVLPDLLEAFLDRDVDARVEQSIAIAMGRLATLDDAPVVEALLDRVDRGRDVMTRHFALVALGEIGARGVRGARDARDASDSRDGSAADGAARDARATRGDTADRAEAVLDALLRAADGRGGSRADRSWGALGAALLGRGAPDAQPRVLEHLRAAYADEKDPRFKGAYAVALGLLRDVGSAPALAEDLATVRDDRFRGHVAVALGMLEHADVAPRLRALCTDRATPPDLRIDAAVGLGLLGDRGSVPVLVDALRDDPPLAVVAGLSRALGLLGDGGAVAPLEELARSERAPMLSRAFACVALGLLGARSELPFQTRVLGHENHMSDSVALAELRSIL